MRVVAETAANSTTCRSQQYSVPQPAVQRAAASSTTRRSQQYSVPQPAEQRAAASRTACRSQHRISTAPATSIIKLRDHNRQGVTAAPVVAANRLGRRGAQRHQAHMAGFHASESAYGACVFVRTVNADSTVACNLLCSKSKVAPLKSVSIPRLELCGALLGARLCEKSCSSRTSRRPLHRCVSPSTEKIYRTSRQTCRDPFRQR
ncbi:uncharacterized protein LOC106716081 isoform X2 [Papilio machaon]|uniref:uncharacterized protein LOC106716081 isoform X2 n=1 Tax=Papilio machaon TaxID=76193 RepID=UPI001E662E21|nr:uncharacterized protein LOC106716081 isoform X2 [Papilio machaon]